jgi:hypothetical protein
LGRGADLTDTLGQYFLKVKALRGLGFTPQALDELMAHYERVEGRVGLTDEQRLKFQGLLYRLLQNKLFAPEEVNEARRFLESIGIPAEQVDDVLIAFQAGKSLIKANDIAFDFTFFEVRRFLYKMREAHQMWREAFLKAMEEHFPDCMQS